MLFVEMGLERPSRKLSGGQFLGRGRVPGEAQQNTAI